MKKFCLTMFTITSVALVGLYLAPSVEAATPVAQSGGEEVDCIKLITKPKCVGLPSNCICPVITPTTGQDGSEDDRTIVESGGNQVPQATAVPRFLQQPIGF